MVCGCLQSLFCKVFFLRLPKDRCFFLVFANGRWVFNGAAFIAYSLSYDIHCSIREHLKIHTLNRHIPQIVTHSLPKTIFIYTPVLHPTRDHSFSIAYSVICHVAISQRRNYSSSLSRLADWQNIQHIPIQLFGSIATKVCTQTAKTAVCRIAAKVKRPHSSQ